MSDHASSPGAEPEVGEDAAFLWDWTEHDWSKLLVYVQPRTFQTGEVLAQQDEADRSLSILVRGRLEVLVPGGAGQEARRIATIETGSVIGEQAFLDGRPRSALVRAAAEGEMLALPLVGFQQFSMMYPELARDFLFDLGRILSLRLRQTTAAAATALAARPMRVAGDAALPVQHIEVDQATRTRQVAEIAGSSFFQDLQSKARQLRQRTRNTSSR